MMRRLLAALMLLGLAVGLTAQADVGSGAPRKAVPTAAPGSSGEKDVAELSATRQAQLRTEFRRFKEKLVLLAGRLEASPKAEDKDRAKSLQAVIELLRQRETESRFDSMIAELRTRKGSELDALQKVARENKELR